LSPTVEPRATDHVAQMRAIIERLIAAGHAYVAEEHVLFHVPSMPDYGALSKRPLDEMEAGARVDVAPYKRSPLDFVLWKPSPSHWPAWESPAGIATPGRPGWHIECSAMAWEHLGETFDIHAGGLDLTFPHHENEIAQSRCCFGTSVMANVWLHNGFLQVEGQKMSKSLGNFLTIRELLNDWPGEVLRLTMLRTHYRQPIDWTLRSVEESARVLERWYGLAGEGAGDPAPAMIEALCDDLNTPLMMAALHGLEGGALGGSLRLLGFSLDKAALARPGAASVDAAAVEALLARRREARAARNWAESDRIRDEIAALGVTVKDNKDGTTTWEVAR
jgi:cysteinyl-tRNA synthetase